LLYVKPWPNAFLDQLLCNLANGRLVLAVVAQEDIKDLGLGVLPVHANAVLYGKNLAWKADFEMKASE
jgi:hypothetical protein